MPTITSASAAFLLSIAGVFPTAVPLAGFGPDEAFDTESVDAAEIQVGVDGTGVAGWVPRMVTQTITLLASSPSNDMFDTWIASMDAIPDVLYATGTIRIPSISKQYSMAMGVLRRYPITANARRVLAPRQYQITWLPQPGIPAVVVSPM